MAKGHAVRFLVEDPRGRTSSTWRVWSNRDKSDVYFAHRDAAGELKGSLHETGDWRYGMTTERLATAANVRGWDGRNRYIMRWKRPPEIVSGLTLAVEFGFLTEELQLIPGVDRKGCIVLPSAPPGEAVLVVLFIAKSDAHLGGRWPGEYDMCSQHVADFPLESGERVYLVSTHITPPPITREDLNAKRREFAWMKDTESLRARFCSVVINEDESRLFIEGAVHPDRVLPA
jgi:hypothetical protein